MRTALLVTVLIGAAWPLEARSPAETLLADREMMGRLVEVAAADIVVGHCPEMRVEQRQIDRIEAMFDDRLRRLGLTRSAGEEILDDFEVAGWFYESAFSVLEGIGGPLEEPEFCDGMRTEIRSGGFLSDIILP